MEWQAGRTPAPVWRLDGTEKYPVQDGITAFVFDVERRFAN
jgi:hypothetical protein